MAGLLVLGKSLSRGKHLLTVVTFHTLDLTVSSSLVLQGLEPTSESLATNTAGRWSQVLCQVRLQVGSGRCAEVTLVTLVALVALRGVVIGQDVAIELQCIDSFNYF